MTDKKGIRSLFAIDNVLPEEVEEQNKAKEAEVMAKIKC